MSQDIELTAEDLRELVATFKGIYEEETGHSFPENPRDQLRRAYRAVFDSWNVPRAQVYRRANDIADDLGTRGQRRADGVRRTAVRAPAPAWLATRDPRPASSGSTASSSRTRKARTSSPGSAPGADRPHASACPRRSSSSWARSTGSNRTTATCRTSSSRSKRTLYLLQTRTGKRTAAAALRVAAEMVDEGLISREEAVARRPARPVAAPHDRSDEGRVAARG